jgi:ribosomal protein S18 acetylase RimI-like enzyme
MSKPEAHIHALNELDIPALIELARAIWYAHYPSIITVEQIEYMLGQRYSPEVIRAQLTSGSAWWDKLLVDGVLVGFAASESGDDPHVMKLDKLYVRNDLQGRGYGSMLVRHVEERALAHGCMRLYLQVNKNNRSAIEAYLKNGFVVTQAATFDIGGGFYMDDYVMTKDIGRKARG